MDSNRKEEKAPVIQQASGKAEARQARLVEEDDNNNHEGDAHRARLLLPSCSSDSPPPAAVVAAVAGAVAQPDPTANSLSGPSLRNSLCG